MELYKPFIYKGKAKKKYSIYVLKNGKKRLIHFGSSINKQYKDKLGHYKNLDHNDVSRRASYRARHKAITTKKDNKPAYMNPDQPSFYSYWMLWT